jgi:hypothetical protein
MAAEESRSLAVGQAAAAGEDRAETKRATAWGEHQKLGDPQPDPKAPDHQSGIDQVHPEDRRATGHEDDEE